MDKLKKIVLSIVVVHYKTKKLTMDCFRSINDHPPTCPYEIILVDNGSNDNIGDQVAEKFPEVRFIETGDNLGFSKANNLGIHNSRGEFVVLLNSDAKLIEPVWDSMIDFMHQQPEVGVIGCREVDGDGNFQLSCGHFPNFKNEIIRKIMHYRLSINDHKIRDYLDEKFSSLSAVDWVSGSCMMIRRKVLADVGLLDEQFFMYFEDIDFCQRVRDKGWGIRYFPGATICHYGGRSAKHNLLHVLVEYRKSQAYFTRKYYGRFGSVLIRIFLIIKYGFSALPWGMVFLIQKFLSENADRSYTMLLLSKKVLGVAVRPIPRRAIITYLKTRN